MPAPTQSFIGVDTRPLAANVGHHTFGRSPATPGLNVAVVRGQVDDKAARHE